MSQSTHSIVKFRNRLTFFGLIITFVFYLLRPSGQLGIYLTTAAAIPSLLIILYALRSVIISLGGGPQLLAYRLLFLGVLSATIGQLLWFLFSLTGQTNFANTIPTIFFLITYIANFLGFLRLSLVFSVKVKEFPGVIVGFSILGIILYHISHAATPINFNPISSVFILGDVVRVVVIAMLLQMVVIYQGGLLGRYWLSIFVGNIFIIMGNFSSAVYNIDYFAGNWPYTLIDLIFVGGYLFVAHGFYGISDSIRQAQRMILSHKK